MTQFEGRPKKLTRKINGKILTSSSTLFSALSHVGVLLAVQYLVDYEREDLACLTYPCPKIRQRVLFHTHDDTFIIRKQKNSRRTYILRTSFTIIIFFLLVIGK